MGIEINKNPSGRCSNMVFGLCSLADGLVRVLSFGCLHSTFTLDYARNQARSRIKKTKQARKEATC